MHLSIFNFKSNLKHYLIINSIICGLFFTLIYSLFVQFLAIRGEEGANQRQTNIVKVQNFLLNPQKYDIIVVGSSMAAEMPVERVIPDCYNLAFSGGSSSTGLYLLKAAGKIPKLLLVEVSDTIMRGTDNILIEQANKTYLLYVPFLANRFRPDFVIMNTFIRPQKNSIPIKLEDPEEPNKTGLFVQQQEFLQTVDNNALNSRLSELASVVNYYILKGVKVIFFEPPLDPSLKNTPKDLQINEAFHSYFPPEKYRWVGNFNYDYKTSDGIHLGAKSADKYGRFLRDQINQLIKYY